jgi:hypothetical protein
LQPLAILFGAAFTAATAYSLGAILLRDSSRDLALRFVAGSSVLSLLVFAACALGIVYPATFLVIGAAAIAVARSGWRIPKLPRPSAWWWIFTPYLVLYFFNAMAPEISFDGSRYHLALVGRYLREHGFHPITDTFYAAFPGGVEMLFLYAYAFGRHSAAAMVHFAFLLALAWQVYAWSRRHGYEFAGKCAAALVFLSPIIGVDGISAYNDVAVAAIAFSLFNVLDLWAGEPSMRLLVAAGLLAGFAFAAKYTAFVAIPLAAAVVFRRKRDSRTVAALLVCCITPVLPWLFKNYLWFQNPVSPLFNHWFPNPYFTSSFEVTYRSQLGSLGAYRLRDLPLQVTTLGSLSGLLGPVFLLSPVVLAVRPWTLAAAAVLFGAPFAANISTRFLIPAAPFLALGIALALRRFPGLLVAVVVLHAILSWPDVLRRYCRPDAWHLAKVTYREALRIKPEDGFLESNLPYYGITRRIEELTPPGSTVLTDTPIPDAYTSRTILVSFQSAANTVSRRAWFSGFVPEHAPVLLTRFRIPPTDIRGLRLDVVGAVHEVRAYEGGRELSRADWRAPEAVVDGRLASLWLAEEPLVVTFAAPQKIDTIEVQTELDQTDKPVLLDGRRGVPDLSLAPSDLRRQAAMELKRRGVDYLLVFDGQFGADDLRDRASDWGVTQVTEYKGARLYRLP